MIDNEALKIASPKLDENNENIKDIKECQI